MAATSHSVALKKVNQAFTSSLHWAALSAESTRLFGRNKSTTKPLGPPAASPGHPMGSYSRFLTVHPVTKRPLFFYYRSIRWKFADSLRRRVRGVISTLHSPPMVKHWPSPEEFGKEPESTRCRFREERNNILSRVLHTTG